MNKFKRILISALACCSVGLAAIASVATANNKPVQTHAEENPAKELFNVDSVEVDRTYGEYENPEATWDKASQTLTIEIKQQGGCQWGNRVYLSTGITTLDTSKEYQFSFTGTASTDNCGGVTFKAFDSNTLVYSNQNLPFTTTPYNYVSEWATPLEASTDGYLVFDFGWDAAQTVTITNISIKERSKVVSYTIADIIPTHFPIRINSDMPKNPWLNENGAKLYLISNGTMTKLQFDGQGISAGGYAIDIALNLTANNENYIYNLINGYCSATITFNMLNGKLDSVNMINYSGSKESDALLNGTYDGILVHPLKETHDKVEPTCTVAGHEAYYECDCGALFSDLALTQEIVDLEAWLGEGGGGYIAPQHNFGKVTYTWNEETHECTASHKCQRDGCTETQSELASIENGKVVYVKDFDATCTANEKGHYEATFTVQEFEKQATSMFDVPNTAKGHDYGTPTYTWNEDYTKCTATATCFHGDSTITNEGTITIEDGYAVATFEDDIFESQRVKLPELAPEKSGLSGGAIAGIAIGSFVGLCLIAYIVMFFIWKKTEKALKFLVPSYEWINKKIFKNN